MTTSTSMPADQEVDRAPNRRARVTARAALVGLLSLGLGLLAHAVSGGPLPSPPILITVAALTALAATLVAQAKLPIWAVMLLLGVAQQLLHWILGGLGGAPSLSGPADHHGEAAPVQPSAAAQGHPPEVTLLLHAHLGAALLVGWAVARYPGAIRWTSRRHEQAARTRRGAPIA